MSEQTSTSAGMAGKPETPVHPADAAAAAFHRGDAAQGEAREKPAGEEKPAGQGSSALDDLAKQLAAGDGDDDGEEERELDGDDGGEEEDPRQHKDFLKAQNALKRLYPESKDIIDGMDPADVLEQGLEAMELAKEGDKAGNELDAAMKRIGELESRLEEALGAREGGEDASQPRESRTGRLDLAEVLQPLKDGLDPDVHPTLDAALKRVVSHYDKRFSALEKAIQGGSSQSQDDIAFLMQGEARRQLEGRIPGLRDDEAFPLVLEAMSEMTTEKRGSETEFARIKRQMAFAAKAVGVKHARSKGKTSKESGGEGPPVPRRTSAGRKQMSHEEKLRLHVQTGIETESVEAAHRASGLRRH